MSKPVDIYSDWIDACEDLEEDIGAGKDGEDFVENDEEEDGEDDDFKARKDPILESDDEY